MRNALLRAAAQSGLSGKKPKSAAATAEPEDFGSSISKSAHPLGSGGSFPV